MVNLDEIREEIISICEKDYGVINHNRYFVATDTSAREVRSNIISKMTLGECKKRSSYLDMNLYILQTGKDVFISLN